MTKRLRVIGVGRVGSYAKAKQGHYSRSRRYWAIAQWSDECKPTCQGKSKGHLHYPVGPVERKDLPHFRTKTAAETYLKEMG